MTNAMRSLFLILMMVNPNALCLVVGATGAASFAYSYFAFAPALSAKDAEQDEHMRDTDSRIAEMQAHRVLQDAEIKENSDNIHNIYGVGSGMFGLITILQVVGLLRKMPREG